VRGLGGPAAPAPGLVQGRDGVPCYRRCPVGVHGGAAAMAPEGGDPQAGPAALSSPPECGDHALQRGLRSVSTPRACTSRASRG